MASKYRDPAGGRQAADQSAAAAAEAESKTLPPSAGGPLKWPVRSTDTSGLSPDSSVGYHDLFSLVGERRRPPYRWMLLGPKRSGTCVHTDPLATSAWNTVVHGKKLWVLFPPGTPKSVVKAKQQVGSLSYGFRGRCASRGLA